MSLVGRVRQRTPWIALLKVAGRSGWLGKQLCAVHKPSLGHSCDARCASAVAAVRIGQVATSTVVFTEKDVATFAALVGDRNGIHIDKEIATASRYGRCVVHGMLLNSALSAVIANDLPGPGTVYLKQTIKFRSPVFVNDPFVARVEVLDVRRDVAVLRTTCHSPGDLNDVLVDGETMVLLDTTKASK